VLFFGIFCYFSVFSVIFFLLSYVAPIPPGRGFIVLFFGNFLLFFGLFSVGPSLEIFMPTPLHLPEHLPAAKPCKFAIELTKFLHFMNLKGEPLFSLMSASSKFEYQQKVCPLH